MRIDYVPVIDPPAPLAATFGAVRAQFGFVPDAVARMAHAPDVLKHLLQGFAAFERTSLPPLARETVIMTVAYRHRCDLCVALHAAKLTAIGADAAVVAALRQGAPVADSALEAIRAFTLRVLETTGSVGDEAMRAFLAAGYSAAQALEVLQGIGIYTLSTYANRLTGATIDPAFAAFAPEEALRS